MGVVAHMVGNAEPPRLYLAGRHAFASLAEIDAGAHDANARMILSTIGAAAGCTLRLIGDYAKVSAAYHHPESLLWRDAGVIVAGLCMTAEWMGLASIPIGLIGSAHLPGIGFPSDRFIGLGAVQVGAKMP